jgi:protein involved in polysaccharide export with SLBB domain
VAVIGAVQKPGTYSLSDSNQTILDVVGLAGGATKEAADRMIFTPARIMRNPAETYVSAATITPVAALAPVQPGDPNVADGSQAPTDVPPAPPVKVERHRVESIPVVLHPVLASTVPKPRNQGAVSLDLTRPQDAACLDIPARPGDIIIVPIAGEVMVEGWVQNPGHFIISPGMTVVGAVAAAGGATFSWTADLLRTGEDGEQIKRVLSLSKMQSGEEPDVTVESGDVVVVERSYAGAVPYGAMKIFDKVGAGFYLPAF